MIFGDAPVTEAEGAILAHSLQAGDTRLRKGRVLGPEDLDVLSRAGIARVTVARLEAGDVEENAAAARLAAALTEGAAGVHVTAPFTGRVNIVADGAGVAHIDAGRINAVNGGDAMITCATVAPLHRMMEGGLLATIKIISYAVPEHAIANAEAAAKGARLGLHVPVVKTARLIVSQTGAEPEAEKGIAAIRGRLDALGAELSAISKVPHELGPLSTALGEAQEDIVLILTGSATSDPADVAPSAVRRAGGQVARFGMPVDPGNLLFIGDLKGVPVIGLPGCARAPALNGADWVLERVVCGLEVTAADIAGMGIGGLLKEIPQRPQPRRGQTK